MPHWGTSILNWFLDMGEVSGACSAFATGWPGIAVPPGAAHLTKNQKLIWTFLKNAVPVIKILSWQEQILHVLFSICCYWLLLLSFCVWIIMLCVVPLSMYIVIAILCIYFDSKALETLSITQISIDDVIFNWWRHQQWRHQQWRHQWKNDVTKVSLVT